MCINSPAAPKPAARLIASGFLLQQFHFPVSKRCWYDSLVDVKCVFGSPQMSKSKVVSSVSTCLRCQRWRLAAKTSPPADHSRPAWQAANEGPPPVYSGSCQRWSEEAKELKFSLSWQLVSILAAFLLYVHKVDHVNEPGTKVFSPGP